MKPHLSLKENPSESFSFLVGDMLREAFVRPWKIIFTPVSFIRLIRRYKSFRSECLESQIEVLYVLDTETMVKQDLTLTKNLLSSRKNDLVASIGEFEQSVDYLIPSRKRNNESKTQWNKDFEKTLESIIATRRPQKMIFMGKYPYAGLLSIVRRLESNENVAWVPMRSKTATMTERAPRFGRIINFSYKPQPKSELDTNSLFISQAIPSKVKSFIIESIAGHDQLSVSNPLNAALHIYSESDKGKAKNALDRGQLVIYLFKSQLDSEFTKSKFATVFFPVEMDDVIEMEYSMTKLLNMYSHQRLTLRTQEQELVENWLSDVKHTFTQTD